jgi:hypothetical protein
LAGREVRPDLTAVAAQLQQASGSPVEGIGRSGGSSRPSSGSPVYRQVHVYHPAPFGVAVRLSVGVHLVMGSSRRFLKKLLPIIQFGIEKHFIMGGKGHQSMKNPAKKPFRFTILLLGAVFCFFFLPACKAQVTPGQPT